jgi:hypothetical protein
MAILITETCIAELRKLFGKYAIFYERGGKKIMQSRPFLSNKKLKKKKEHDMANWERIYAAQIIAKEILLDPIKKAEYQAKAIGTQCAFNVLVHELCQQTKQNQ